MKAVAINNNGHKTVMVADERDILRILMLDATCHGAAIKAIADAAKTVTR